jgi:tetratricopeptide (TPR) repeat protein
MKCTAVLRESDNRSSHYRSSKRGCDQCWSGVLSRARLWVLALGKTFLLLQCALQPGLTADGEQLLDWDLDQIQAVLQKQETVPASAVKKLETMIETNPGSCRARLLLAQYYEKMALTDEAAEQYAMAVKDAPNDRRKLLDLIKSEVALGRLKAAAVLAEEACRRFPNSARISFVEGQILVAQKQADKAKQAFLSADKQAKRSGEKILGLPTAVAELRNDEKRFSEAYSLAEIDISHDAKFWPAYKARGVAALGLGYLDEAVKLLFVAYRNLDQADVSGYFAMAAYRSGRFDAALGPALINLSANPLPGEFSAGPKKLIIDIWRKLPAHAAETVLTRTESRSSLVANAAYHFAMGEVMDTLKRFDIAVREYQCALQARPNFEQAFYRRGLDMEVYFHHYDDAVVDYMQALKLLPGDYDVQQSLRRLQNRLERRPNDISWQLKDMLSTPRE